MENIQYIYTDDKKRKKVMGTLASIGIEIEILDPEKPVLGISRMDNIVKISGRTSMFTSLPTSGGWDVTIV